MGSSWYGMKENDASLSGEVMMLLQSWTNSADSWSFAVEPAVCSCHLLLPLTLLYWEMEPTTSATSRSQEKEGRCKHLHWCRRHLALLSFNSNLVLWEVMIKGLFHLTYTAHSLSHHGSSSTREWIGITTSWSELACHLKPVSYP